MTLSYNMHVWPWSVAMSDSSNLVRGTLYIVFCSFIVKNTHWTKGWKCLWRGHSVNQNRPLLSLSLQGTIKARCLGRRTQTWPKERTIKAQAGHRDMRVRPSSAGMTRGKWRSLCRPRPLRGDGRWSGPPCGLHVRRIAGHGLLDQRGLHHVPHGVAGPAVRRMRRPGRACVERLVDLLVASRPPLPK